MKKLKTIKHIIYILLLFLIITGLIIIYKGRKTDKIINDFISRGEYINTIDNVSYYKVKRQYEYESNNRVFDINEPNYVGYKGDIYLTSRNPLSFSIVTKFISNQIWVGHAGMVIDEEGKYTIEITGNDINSNNHVRILDNSWATDAIDTTNEYLVLRVKNANEDKLNEVINKAKEKVGSKYNYLFILNKKNKYYCTDLVTRSYKECNINISKGNIVTTGSDLINNKNTYLVYYKNKIYKNGSIHYNVYYLE